MKALPRFAVAVALSAAAGTIALHLALPQLALPPLFAAGVHDAGPTGTVTSTDGSVGDELRAGRRARRFPARDRAGTRERRAETRRRISDGGDGTYIADVLAGHDSALARWPDRLARPIAVWIQPASPVAGWRRQLPALARDAFTQWQATGIPLAFTFVDDSGAAEVHLTWIDRFAQPISGRTRWSRDDAWWILDGRIAIAVHHSRGEPLDDAAIRAIALHEVGHLIGLDHTRDPLAIMTPRVRVRALSSADRATVRLLYTLPAGAVR